METNRSLLLLVVLFFCAVFAIVLLYFFVYIPFNTTQDKDVPLLPPPFPVEPSPNDSDSLTGTTTPVTIPPVTNTVSPPQTTTTMPDTTTMPNTTSTPPLVEVPVLPPPAVVATHNTRVGLAVGETLSVVSEAELARRMDDFANIGIRWLRVDVAWNSIQPQGPDAFRWEPLDRIVRHANARNIAILALITYTPDWAQSVLCRGTKKCEPRDPREFATFAGEVAKRYTAHGVYHYQIWNEPNMRLFWAAGASPERYTALLKESARAIRTENIRATVLSGGLAAVASGDGNMSAREFLEGMYTYGARGHFDILGYHPHSYPLAPHFFSETSPWSQIVETEWSMRSIMEKNGDSTVQMWITEYGAPTGGPGRAAPTSSHGLSTRPTHVTETFQSIILREAFEENEKLTFTGPLFWYSYQDLGTSSDTVENHFGILRADGSKKPAYEMLFQVARR